MCETTVRSTHLHKVSEHTTKPLEREKFDDGLFILDIKPSIMAKFQTSQTQINTESRNRADRRCEDGSLMNSSRDNDTNTPTIDFDDWAEDPFTLAKESDAFPPFTGVDEVANNANSNKPADFPPLSQGLALDKTSRATTEVDISKKKNGVSRKRIHSQVSSKQKETNSTPETNTDSKSASSSKKKSDYIPISRRKKKPKCMPKRPLSAYNLYFQAERTKIIANQQQENGPRIGFEGLGKIIGKQWRDLSSADKKEYEKLAEKDSERYRKEMDAYHEMKAKRLAEEDRLAAEQTPVLSRMASSKNSVQSSQFGNEQGSLRMVPVGDAFGSSTLLSHPPNSLVSAISSFPPGTSYRAVHLEQPPSSSKHPSQHSNTLDPNNSHTTAGALQGGSFPLYPPRPAGPHIPDQPSYNDASIGPGIAAALSNHNCPMPPGMGVVLPDRNGIERKYRVHYTCYSMTRENANKYIESLTGTNSDASPPRPPQQAGTNSGYNGGWGM